MGIEAVENGRPFNLLKPIRRAIDSLRHRSIVEAQAREARGLLARLQGSKFPPTKVDGQTVLDLKDLLGPLATALTTPTLEISPTYQKQSFVLVGFAVCELSPAPSRIMVRLVPDVSNQLPRAEIDKFVTVSPNGGTTTGAPQLCIPDRIVRLNLISSLANIVLDSKEAKA